MDDTTSFYERYKPLRNRLQKMDLQNLLKQLHGLQLTMGDKVQENFHNVVDGTRFVASKWDIHRLVCEAIINCPAEGSTKQIGKNNIADLLFDLGKFKSHLEKAVLTSPSAALDMLHPMLHHQFSFQQKNDLRRLYRAFKIYGDDLLSQKVHDVLGLSLQSIFKLTYSVAGAARSSLFINAQNYFDFDGIGQKTVEAYFSMMGTNLEKLREEMMGLSRYDKRWLYTWNPLEARPLVRPNPVGPHLYWCPCPELLIRRATDGLFFDLVDKDGDFGNPYGKAFQNYCGLALHQQFTEAHHRILEERQYMVNGQKKDGVDWIVSDHTGHLMIECKARRLRIDAKLDANDKVVDEALDVLADELRKV